MGPGTTDSGDQGPGGAEDTVSGARVSHSASASSVSRANRFLPLSLSLLIRMMGILRPICDKVRKWSHCGTAIGSRPLGHCGGTEGKFKVENVTFQHPVFLPPPPLPEGEITFRGLGKDRTGLPWAEIRGPNQMPGECRWRGMCVRVCVCARMHDVEEQEWEGKGTEEDEKRTRHALLPAQSTHCFFITLTALRGRYSYQPILQM